MALTAWKPLGGAAVIAASVEGRGWGSSNSSSGDVWSVAALSVPEGNYSGTGDYSKTGHRVNSPGNPTDKGLAYDFGFSVPAGATIDAVRVRYHVGTLHTDRRGEMVDCHLTVAGATGTKIGASNIDSSYFGLSSGTVLEVTFLPADVTLTAADVNSANFGSVVQFTRVAGDAGSNTHLWVDAVEAQVEYTDGPGDAEGRILVMDVAETGSDAAGVVMSSDIGATLSASEAGPDAAAVAVSAPAVLAMAATESGGDIAAILASSGEVLVLDMAAVETGPDTAAVSIAPVSAMTLAAIEPQPDTMAAAASTSLSAALSAAEAGPDTASVTMAPHAALAVLAAEEGQDVAAMTVLSGDVLRLTLDATESGPDTAVVEMSSGTSLSVAAGEVGPDAASIAVASATGAAMAASETGRDTAQLAASSVATVAMAAVEQGQDLARITNIDPPPILRGLGSTRISISIRI